MHTKRDQSNSISKINIILECSKIGIALLLLLLGIHVILWSVDTVDKIINNTEDISIVNRFIDLQTDQQILDITFNNDQIVVKSNNVTKWIVLILLILVLFNIIGRAIMAILNSMVSIILNVDFKKLHPKNLTDDLYNCEHCAEPYRLSDYRHDTIMICSSCSKVMKPKY